MSLSELKNVIDRWTLLGDGAKGWTASLEDEEAPDGWVLLKDERGHVRVRMLREDYDAMKSA